MAAYYIILLGCIIPSRALQVYAEVTDKGGTNAFPEGTAGARAVGLPADAYQQFQMFLDFQQNKDEFHQWKQRRQASCQCTDGAAMVRPPASSAADFFSASESSAGPSKTGPLVLPQQEPGATATEAPEPEFVVPANSTVVVIEDNDKKRSYVFTLLPYFTFTIIICCFGFRCVGNFLWSVIRRDIAFLYRALHGSRTLTEVEDAKESEVGVDTKDQLKERRRAMDKAIRETGIHYPPVLVFQKKYSELRDCEKWVFSQISDDPEADWQLLCDWHNDKLTAEERPKIDFWWDELSEKQQTLLRSVGFGPRQWNNEGGGSRYIHHKRWKQMGEFEKHVSRSQLGITGEKAWDHRTASIFHKPYLELSVKEKAALDSIGWRMEHWKPDPHLFLDMAKPTDSRHWVLQLTESWLTCFVEVLKESASVILTIYLIICILAMGILKPFLQQIIIYSFLALLVLAAVVTALTDLYNASKDGFEAVFVDMKVCVGHVRLIWDALRQFKPCKNCAQVVRARCVDTSCLTFCLPCGADDPPPRARSALPRSRTYHPQNEPIDNPIPASSASWPQPVASPTSEPWRARSPIARFSRRPTAIDLDAAASSFVQDTAEQPAALHRARTWSFSSASSFFAGERAGRA